jgi:hypothetical protein
MEKWLGEPCDGGRRREVLKLVEPVGHDPVFQEFGGLALERLVHHEKPLSERQGGREKGVGNDNSVLEGIIRLHREKFSYSFREFSEWGRKGFFGSHTGAEKDTKVLHAAHVAYRSP